ncbi:unnamed protein product [Trichobilharzia regenti]|nr:unnamed protein product [Trichobilharzia regenti]
MKEEFKLVRGEQREFIDSLLHPNRIQVYNLPIKINAILRSYQQVYYTLMPILYDVLLLAYINIYL